MTTYSFSRPARRRQSGVPPAPVYAVFEADERLERSLVQLFNLHNEQGKRLLSYSTLKHYYVTQRYLISFLREQYGADDVEMTSLDYAFISGFETFLYALAPRDQRHPLQMNGILKHLTRLKKMVNLAVNLDWLMKDPFKNFKMRRAVVDKSFLNLLELKAIEQTSLNGRRLQTVRDVFVFACYTGLAFVDMAGLRREHVVTGMDGELWIKSFRQKTKTPVKTPLLPVPLAIVERYLQLAHPSPKAAVFPAFSNQKTNAYLKEIANLCGVHQNLTFHVARHTFATTVTLSNGVPIETVSKMLGHTKLSTTQVYARVLEDKISHDMNQLKKVLAVEV